MIQANELRIGNVLNKDGIIVTIDALSIYHIWEKSDKYAPIPLTPEILERCGFDENLWQLRIINENGIYKFDIGGILTDNVFYLHQLQNLYFALTGKELEIKL